MSDEIIPLGQGSSKISYDARAGRAKLLTGWLYALGMSTASDDYHNWYRSLRNIYFLCCPYTSSSDVDKVRKQLRMAADRLNMLNTRNYDQRLIYSVFDHATELTLTVFRDQLMQASKTSDEDFDVDSFMKGSQR